MTITEGTPAPLCLIRGTPVHVGSIDAAVRGILARLRERTTSFFICTLNLDHLVKLAADPLFRAIYDKAAMVTADGFPIVLLARFQGLPLSRTTGADLIAPLCGEAAAQNLPVFLIGPDAETLAICQRRLTALYPGLQVVGRHAPAMGFEPTGEAATRLIGDVAGSGARLCFVGLGAPKQEVFSAFAVERTDGIGFIPIGAGLQYLAGTRRRAPRWMQRCALEWAWRLGSEPRRMMRRYFECALVFGGTLAQIRTSVRVVR